MPAMVVSGSKHLVFPFKPPPKLPLDCGPRPKDLYRHAQPPLSLGARILPDRLLHDLQSIGPETVKLQGRLSPQLGVRVGELANDSPCVCYVGLLRGWRARI